MHGGNSGEDEPMGEMNLIPLIDVALTLLIIMMVTTAFVRKPGVSLKLPETVTREGAPEMSKDLSIAIAANGTMYIDSQPQSVEQVQNRLRAVARANKDARVLIKGDQNVIYAHVALVIDLARQAGLTKVTLPTDPKIGQALPAAPTTGG